MSKHLIKHCLFVVSFVFLVGCIQEKLPISELEFSEGTNASFIKDKAAQNNFEQTVYKITTERCISCHTDQTPKHAHPDVETALEELVRYEKVDLEDPEKSRIYLKIKNESHGCWSNCDENAEVVLASIEKWIELGVDKGKVDNVEPAKEEEEKICVASITEKIVDCSETIENAKVAIQQEICGDDGLVFVKNGICSVQECNENYEIKDNVCVEMTNDPVSMLVFSKSSTRTNPQEITGKILSGDNYIFFESQIENIAKVEFYLDGNLEKSEATPPFDFQGDEENGNAIPFDSSALANGNHIFEIKVYQQDINQSIDFSYNFSINNMVVDNTKPTITLMNSNIGNDNKVYATQQSIDISFNEMIQGFEQDDVVVTGATLATFLKINDLQYKIALDISQTGQVSVVIPQGAVGDIYGNINEATELTFIYEQKVYDGVAIYNAKCLSCHLDLSQEKLVNRTSDQIQTAISSVGDMINSNKDLHLLTLEEIKAIAVALKSDDKLELACDDTAPVYSDMRRLTDYEIKNAYADIFGSSIVSSTKIKDALNLLENDRSDTSFQSRSITSSQAEAILNLAYEVGEMVASSSTYRQTLLGSCANEASISNSCLNSMFDNFFKLIYRRSLKTEEKIEYQSLLSEMGSSPQSFISMAIGKALSSPYFIFVNTFEGTLAGNEISLTSQELATKLALTYWGSVPTLALIQFSESSDLKNKTLLANKANEILLDDKAKKHFSRFVIHWINKNKKTANYPDGFVPMELDLDKLDENIEKELELYLSYVIWEQNGSFNDLFSSKGMFVHNSQMSLILGHSMPNTENGFMLSQDDRRGLFARPFFLRRSGTERNDIIHRGLDIKQNFLCEMIGDPNDAVSADEINAEVNIDKYEVTTREYVHTQTFTKNQCMLCHSQFNGFGYSLEGYDDLGRKRAQEQIYDAAGDLHKSIAVATSGEIVISGENLTFANHIDIQNKIGNMNRAKQCMSKKWYHFIEHVEPKEENSCQINALISGFEVKDNKGGTIKDVLSGFINDKYFSKRLIK